MLKRIFLYSMTMLCLFSANGQGLYPVKKDGLMGYINDSGRLVIPYRFKTAGFVNQFNRTARASDGKNTYLILVPDSVLEVKDCDKLEVVNNRYFKAFKNGLWYLTDQFGIKISEKGYTQIYPVKGVDTLFYVVENGLTGLCNQHNAYIFDPIYPNISQLTGDLYKVQTKQRSWIILCANCKTLSDTFSSIAVSNDNPELIKGVNKNSEDVYLHRNGELIIRSEDVQINNFANEFIEVKVRKGRRYISQLYDLQSRRFVDSLEGPFANSNVKNTIYFNDKKLGMRLYNRFSGVVDGEANILLMSDVPPYLVYKEGYFGLLDSAFKIILKTQYLEITKIYNNRVLIRDSSNTYAAIFNYKKRIQETDFSYLYFKSGDNYIKAYRPNNGMDLISFNAEDAVDEIVTFENVKSVKVQFRTTDFDDWSKQNSTFTSGISGRPNGWRTKEVSIKSGGSVLPQTRYELHNIPAQGVKDTVLIKPIFSDVRLIQNQPLTIARFGGISLGGSPSYVYRYFRNEERYDYVIVNDSIGKIVSMRFQYIQREDVENLNVTSFFAVRYGVGFIVNKENFKQIIKCTFAYPQYAGVRGVYKGGQFTFYPKSDRQVFDYEATSSLVELGFYNLIKRYTFELTGGEWFLERDGVLTKPQIAAPGLKIIHMTPFVKGKCIVVLSNRKYGVIDSSGATVIPANYDIIYKNPEFPGKFFCGKSLFRKGLIDANEATLTEPVYTQIRPQGAYYLAYKNDTMELISGFGQTVSPLGVKLRSLTVGDGLVSYKVNKDYVICDTLGIQVGQVKCQGILPFQNGYAPAKHGEFWGLIDQTGNWVIQPHFKDARKGGKQVYIFKKFFSYDFYTPDGRKLFHPGNWNAVAEYGPNLYLLGKKDKFYTLSDSNGKHLNPGKFKATPALYMGSVLVQKGNNIHYLNPETGKYGGKAKLGRSQSLVDVVTQHKIPLKNAGFNTGNGQMFKFSAAQLRAYGADTISNKPTKINISRSFELQHSELYEATFNDLYLTRDNFNLFTFRYGNGMVLHNEFLLGATPMKDGKSICKIFNGKYGLLNSKGEWQITPIYNNLKSVGNGLYEYTVAYEFDICDSNGQILFDSAAQGFYKTLNMLQVKSRNRVGYLHPTLGVVWSLME